MLVAILSLALQPGVQPPPSRPCGGRICTPGQRGERAGRQCARGPASEARREEERTANTRDGTGEVAADGPSLRMELLHGPAVPVAELCDRLRRVATCALLSPAHPRGAELSIFTPST